jgi:hypothetical protein
VSCLLLAMPALAAAQVGTEGAILGIVADSSGSIVPGADVTVKNLETGLTKTAVSDTSGGFEILPIPRGWYSVTVTLQGFNTWVLARTEVTVGERRRVSPVLTAGDLSEQVTVTVQQDLLQTDRSSVEGVIQNRQIKDLPLGSRNVIELVNLVPGLRFQGRGNVERISTIAGFGVRDDQTEFQIDGLTANSGMDEGGMTVPNPDAVEEVAVETSSFSAEHGRNPLQVLLVTKSGTNQFKGTGWEFRQDDAFNAKDRNSSSKPQVDRHQYGYALGGPVFKSRTFFFSSVEGTRNAADKVYNNASVVTQSMMQGDFSALATTIRDPLTGQPFPGNRIPTDRISGASKFFLPYFLTGNQADGRFRATAPGKTQTWESVQRVDHMLTDRQRIYGRWIMQNTTGTNANYRPDYITDNKTTQHNVALNYVNTITNSLVLNASFGYIKSNNRTPDPSMGVDNLVADAGIQGIPTAGREDFVGLPNINVTGWTGINTPFGVPGRLWFSGKNAKIGLNWLRGAHTVNAGYEFNDRTTYGRHGSGNPRGTFNFNGQYSGDAFADYLLGFMSSTARNFPLETFGMQHSPYSAGYVQDNWRASPTVTVNVGLRVDYWHEKELVAGNGSTFDPVSGKVVAGVSSSGQIDLTHQPVAPFLAAATSNLWAPATDLGIPPGLFKANAHVSPRLGLTWRPDLPVETVVRAGYGTFFSSFRGNRTASSIVGLPYWTVEALSFDKASNQRWETAWPADPSKFVQPSVTEAPAWNVDAQRARQWNLSVQTALPWKSSLTVAYVGSKIDGVMALHAYNEVPPGNYGGNLQAAKPYPVFGSLNILENLGQSWYNALQMKLDRRFSNGLSFGTAYAFSKSLGDKVPSADTGVVEPFAPDGYQRGRSDYDRTHVLFVNTLYELPFGRDRRFLGSAPAVVNAIAGGWQLGVIYSFTSGAPLTINTTGARLGNGRDTRADLVGDPSVSSPSAAQWFNTSAFAAPALFTFGSSGIGIIDGPAVHGMDLSLMKNFYIGSRYLQARIEAFNALNHSDLNNPNTTFGNVNFGRVTSVGGPRTVQLGLKFYF